MVAACLDLLTDENMAYIARKVVEECSRDPENITIKTLKRSIQDANTAIENLLIAIESGQAVETPSGRLIRRQAEKADLEAQLAAEKNKVLLLTEPQVYAFLDYVRSLPSDDIVKRRAIINIFVNAVYLYDDYLTLIINASTSPVSEKDIPLGGIEETLDESEAMGYSCSAQSLQAPPKRKALAITASALNYGIHFVVLYHALPLCLTLRFSSYSFSSARCRQS